VGLDESDIADTYKRDGALGLYKLMLDECGKVGVKVDEVLLTSLIDKSKTFGDERNAIKKNFKHAVKSARSVDDVKIAKALATATTFHREHTLKPKLQVANTSVERLKNELGRSSTSNQQLQENLDELETLKVQQAKIAQRVSVDMIHTAQTDITKQLQSQSEATFQMEAELMRQTATKLAVEQELIQSRKQIVANKSVLESVLAELYNVKPEDALDVLNNFNVEEYEYDSDGNPVTVIVREDGGVGSVAKMTLIIEKLQENSVQVGQRCAAMLNQHGIGSQDSWNSLIDVIMSPTVSADTRKRLSAQFTPCLMDAVNATKLRAYSKYEKYVDNNGFFNIPSDKMTALHSELFDPASGKTSVKLPSLIQLSSSESDEARQAFLSWMKMASDDTNTMTDDEKTNYWRYSGMGTGFSAGEVPIVEKGENILIKLLEAQVITPQKTLAINKELNEELKASFRSMVSHNYTKDFQDWKHLSPTARVMLELREKIIEQVVCDLQFGNIVTFTPFDMQLVRLSRRSAVAVEELDNLTHLSQGLLDPFKYEDVSGEAFAVFKFLFESFSKSALSGVDLTTNIADRAHFAVVKCMDHIFNVNHAYSKMGNLSDSTKRTSLLNKMYESAVQSTESGICTAEPCTAYMWDQFLRGMEPSVQKEIYSFCHIPLVEDILHQMQLPPAISLSSKYKDDTKCGKIFKILINLMSNRNDDFKDAVTQLRATLVLSGDQPKWHNLCAKAIQASQIYRSMIDNFMGVQEFTQSDLLEHFKLDRATVVLSSISSKVIPTFIRDTTKTTPIDDDEEDEAGKLKEIHRAEEEFIDLVKAIRLWGATGLNKISYNAVKSEFMLYTTSLADNANDIPIVLPMSFVHTTHKMLRAVNARTLLLADEKREPLLMKLLYRVFDQLLHFGNAFLNNVTAEDLPLGEEIYRKQLRLMYRQAENLCMLPESECGAEGRNMHCKYVNQRCISNELHVLKKKGDNFVTEWKPSVSFSKTSIKSINSPYKMIAKDDVATIGWDTVKSKMLMTGDLASDKFALDRINQLRVRQQFEEFLETICSRSILAEKNISGDQIMLLLIAKIEKRNAIIEKIRHKLRCENVYHVIDVLAKMINYIMTNFGTDALAKAKYAAGSFTVLFKTIESVVGNPIGTSTVPIESEEILGKGKIIEVQPLGLGVVYARWLIQRLISGLFNHFNELRYFKCDMGETRCKATATANRGLCRWDNNKCYNPLLQKIEARDSFAGALGAVQRAILPNIVRIITSKEKHHI
jgi:hypothetical protein